jgi:ribosomal protein S18 acetylase RimI-like enzyme
MNHFKLISCTKNHIETLSTWCKSQHEIEQWAGPNVRFPYSSQTFLEDIKYLERPSYGLINHNNELVAFGQFYERLSHCHLGRLIVNPTFRKQGVSKILVKELSKVGKKTLGLPSISLFVYANNAVALTLYKSLGFIEKNYPEKLPLENCLYLTNVDENEYRNVDI